MPRSRIAILVLLLAGHSITSAQQNAAINDYLRPVVSSIAADPNAGGWAWETNFNGGYLLRMEMDVTGDGRPEVFITTSLTAAKQIAEWTVFDVNESGVMRPYERTIRLPADSVWPSTEKNSPSLIYVAAPNREREQSSEDKVYPVYRFAFMFPTIKETLSYDSEEDAAKLRPIEPTAQPKLQAILLADYLTKPETKWADVPEWKLDTNDCFYRAEDKSRVTNNLAFTPQVALARLGIIKPLIPKEIDKSKQPQSKPTPQPLTAHEAEQQSHNWIILLVIVIVGTLGAFWSYLRKSK